MEVVDGHKAYQHGVNAVRLNREGKYRQYAEGVGNEDLQVVTACSRRGHRMFCWQGFHLGLQRSGGFSVQRS